MSVYNDWFSLPIPFFQPYSHPSVSLPSLPSLSSSSSSFSILLHLAILLPWSCTVELSSSKAPKRPFTYVLLYAWSIKMFCIFEIYFYWSRGPFGMPLRLCKKHLLCQHSIWTTTTNMANVNEFPKSTLLPCICYRLKLNSG